MLCFLKFFFTRSIVFYFLCFFLVWRILDYNQLINNAIPQVMSRLTPPMDYFAEFVDKEEPYDAFKLMNCVNYHKAVTQFFGFQKAEGFGMLGFCYERLGRQSQAIESYQQSIAVNADYFWPYYDLGVIAYRQGQYAKAGDYFKRAIEQNPIKTIFLLSRSKVYSDVKLSKEAGVYDTLNGLKEGRLQAYILWMDSLFKAGAYEQLGEVAINGLKQGMDVQGIFYYYAGMAAFYQKSYPKAVEILQIALQKDPRNSDALLYLGMCLKEAGREDMAQAIISKAGVLHKQGGSLIEPYLKARVRFF